MKPSRVAPDTKLPAADLPTIFLAAQTAMSLRIDREKRRCRSNHEQDIGMPAICCGSNVRDVRAPG